MHGSRTSESECNILVRSGDTIGPIEVHIDFLSPIRPHFIPECATLVLPWTWNEPIGRRNPWQHIPDHMKSSVVDLELYFPSKDKALSFFHSEQREICTAAEIRFSIEFYVNYTVSICTISSGNFTGRQKFKRDTDYPSASSVLRRVNPFSAEPPLGFRSTVDVGCSRSRSCSPPKILSLAAWYLASLSLNDSSPLGTDGTSLFAAFVPGRLRMRMTGWKAAGGGVGVELDTTVGMGAAGLVFLGKGRSVSVGLRANSAHASFHNLWFASSVGA